MASSVTGVLSLSVKVGFAYLLVLQEALLGRLAGGRVRAAVRALPRL